MRNKGFTLVELLVVISIIALLIAILVPSLQAARILAKSMICLTNLRNLATASNIYGGENEGYLPPYGYDSDGELRKGIGPSGMYSTHATLVGDFFRIWEGPGESVEQPNGVIYTMYAPQASGFLYVGGYVAKPETYYCPAWNKNTPKTTGTGMSAPTASEIPRCRLSTADGPWGSLERGFGSAWDLVTNKEPHIRGTYYYNCHASASDGKYTYPRLEDYPAEKFLAMDMIMYNENFCVHTLGGYSWNVVHADGHARKVMSGEAMLNLDTWSLDGWRRWLITYMETAD